MANDGKWLEKLVQPALEKYKCLHPSFYHRFYDSHSAGGYLPAQPGDFLWLLPSLPAVLIEVKSTEKSAPLKSLLDAGQCGKHRLWIRAGHLTGFIYGDRATDRLAWYRGQDVLTLLRGKKPKAAVETDLNDIDNLIESVTALLTKENNKNV